jgi:hypothetical protein
MIKEYFILSKGFVSLAAFSIYIGAYKKDLAMAAKWLLNININITIF